MELGKICTRCGKCCTAIPCGIGFAVFGKDTGKCIGLEKDGDLFYCGLVREPGLYLDLGDKSAWKSEWMSNFIAGMLGIGLGCCSSMEGKRISSEMRGKLLK